MLKHTMVNINHYQDDTNLLSKTIPELINLINDEDQALVQNAIFMVYQLSKKETFRHIIMQSPQIVSVVIRTVVENEQNLELVKTGAHFLYNLSLHRQGLLTIFKTGGINCLVKLLNSPVENVVSYSISTLHNLLLHQEGSKMVVRLNGGLQKMVSLLARNNYKLLTFVTDCLHILGYGNQEGKLIILASGGPQELIRIMKTYTYEKLLWTTSRVLMVLSVCSSNKPAIIQAGGMQALSLYLKNTSERLVQSCLFTLRNLSDDPSIINENINTLIHNLVELLNSDKTNIILCVTGILSNLTSNNQTCKQIVCQCNAIPALINIIIKNSERDDILEPTICILRHLTIRHTEADFASNSIRINNGIPILIKLVNPSSRWFLIKVVVNLLRNLAFNIENFVQFRELNILSKLINLLIKAQNEIKRNKSSDLNNGTSILNDQPNLLSANTNNNVYIDGVSMNEIIEATVGILQLLAKQPQNREILCTNNELVPILVELLYNDAECVQRICVGLLCELAIEKEGAEKIEIEGATVPLTNLLNSRNESISAYAAAVLYKLSDGKSVSYKKQLTSELTNSLYRDDNLNLNSLNNTNPNWQMTINANTNDLDLNNLFIHHPQFSNINNNLTQPALNQVNSTLYQNAYSNQAIDQLQASFPLDSSLTIGNNQPFNPYGQINSSTLQQQIIQQTQRANLNNSGWYDTDL